MKRLLRDPLVVFLLIGAGIFLLYSKLNPEETVEAANPNRIEITSDIQNLLVSEWTARWNRPPAPVELEGLINNHIKEEILFREASKLGLDQSDTIIRRRLAQKMEFLTSDNADLEDVTDDRLSAYYSDNADQYRIDPSFAFQQLYFSTDQRKEATIPDAKALLASLNDGSLTYEQALEQTDRTLLSSDFSLTPLPQIGRQFGGDFQTSITDAKPGDWFGPVVSGYGVHLVKVIERNDANLPDLQEIREDVLSDYRMEQQEKLNKSMLDALLENYEVVIAERIADPNETPEP